ncbi:histidine kinase [Streptomyces cacaoi]|uniref:histidine kinase n=1 Tax=Streptomyces cacaoi TaxID=1898 RepID=UPI001CA99308|nr:histidine kinase [Streptomyces cacaoi]
MVRALLLVAAVCAAPLTVAVQLGGQDAATAAVAVPLLAGAALAAARFPLVVTAVPVALSLTADTEMLRPEYWPALALFGYLAGCRAGTARPALWFFGTVALAGLLLSTLVARELWAWPAQLLTLLGTTGLPWLVGRHRRQYGELVHTGWRLAEEMEAQQRAAADRARVRERARIAGDMHDSLGHDLALLAVRAGALQVDPRLADDQRAAAGELREAAAAATARLRDIIGVLREDGDQPPTGPVDESVESLVRSARASGLTVELEGGQTAEALPPMAARAAHRVVQEALTNAAKHAPGAAVRVVLERGPGAGGAHGGPGGGHGGRNGARDAGSTASARSGDDGDPSGTIDATDAAEATEATEATGSPDTTGSADSAGGAHDDVNGADAGGGADRAGAVCVVRVVNGPPPGGGSQHPAHTRHAPHAPYPRPSRQVPGTPLASGGVGLVGLDERVRVAGGSLHSGVTAQGGFEVVARLPVAAVPGAARPARGPAPTLSSREWERTRRRVRRSLAQTVLGPVAVVVGILVLMIPVSVVSDALSVLDRSAYDRLHLGERRGALEDRLPPFTRDGPPDDAPRTPPGKECVYYGTGLYSVGAYRLCFAGGVLVSKAVL